jgi:hypothetical protein
MEESMRKNMNMIDRIVRFILAVAIMVILYIELVKQPFITILGIIGIIFVITSILGWCPLYTILKISTLRKKTSGD